MHVWGWKLILMALMLITSLSTLVAKTHIEYQINWGPLKKHPKLYKELMDSKEAMTNGFGSRERFTRHIEILNTVLKSHPDWVDGLWMVGSETFQLASSYTEEKDHDLAKKIFTQGQEATEKCLKIDADNALCKLFLASCLAKIGTIEGVFASMSKAELVEELWLDVAKSKYNFHFTPHISMQGGVNYALGIFYRLVPDFAIIKWIYGVRGDMDLSVSYHRKSLQIDHPDLPCTNLMLGAALICQAEDKSGQEAKKVYDEGIHYLNRAKRSLPVTYSVNSEICQADAQDLLKNNSKSCGYSMARQQEPAKENQVNPHPKEGSWKQN